MAVKSVPATEPTVSKYHATFAPRPVSPVKAKAVDAELVALVRESWDQGEGVTLPLTDLITTGANAETDFQRASAVIRAAAATVNLGITTVRVGDPVNSVWFIAREPRTRVKRS